MLAMEWYKKTLYHTYVKNSFHELEQHCLLLHIYIGDFRLLWLWFLNVFLIRKYCTFCIFCILFHQSFILHFIPSTTHSIFYYLCKRTNLLRYLYFLRRLFSWFFFKYLVLKKEAFVFKEILCKYTYFPIYCNIFYLWRNP